MLKPSANISADYAQAPLRETTNGSLLELLLSDVATDMEVVARELGLRDEMLERMRRALERLDCAQAILDAQRKRLLGSSGDEIWEQVSEAVRMLAGDWPHDYPEGAVEWLTVRDGGQRPGS